MADIQKDKLSDTAKPQTEAQWTDLVSILLVRLLRVEEDNRNLRKTIEGRT